MSRVVVQTTIPADLATLLQSEVDRSQFSVSTILRLALKNYLTGRNR